LTVLGNEGVPMAAVSPELAQGIEAELRAQGEEQLADQVPGLRVTEICRCELPYCGSFWTTRRPMKRWLLRGRQVTLTGELPARVLLDVVRGEIVYVEVLHWDDVREALLGLSGSQPPGPRPV
jgi:hypothetical protein